MILKSCASLWEANTLIPPRIPNPRVVALARLIKNVENLNLSHETEKIVVGTTKISFDDKKSNSV